MLTVINSRLIGHNFIVVYTILDELGGYLPPSTVGPSDLTPLLTRLYEVNGTPLLDIYLDYDQNDRLSSSIYIDVPESTIFSSSVLYPHLFRYVSTNQCIIYS